MKKALLVLLIVVLAGCGRQKSQSSHKYYKVESTMATINEDGNVIEITAGETLEEVLKKLHMEYQDSFGQVDKAELITYKLHSREVTISIENFRIGHEFVDCAYAATVTYKTGDGQIVFCFDPEFSEEDIRNARLHIIMQE